MATILLLDSDTHHRDSIALLLRAHRHTVLAFTNHFDFLAKVASRITEIDVILADTINGDETLWRQLEHICRLRSKDGLPPLIICSQMSNNNSKQ